LRALSRAGSAKVEGKDVSALPDSEGEEARCIRRARAADPGAFEQLYRANVDRVYGLCLRMTGNRSEAEDCTQEAFIQAWHKLDRFRG
jgi:RNA polymerase sigma-70 factor (ECF subfamily)